MAKAVIEGPALAGGGGGGGRLSAKPHAPSSGHHLSCRESETFCCPSVTQDEIRPEGACMLLALREGIRKHLIHLFFLFD